MRWAAGSESRGGVARIDHADIEGLRKAPYVVQFMGVTPTSTGNSYTNINFYLLNR